MIYAWIEERLMLRTCTFEGFLECGPAVVDASVELNIMNHEKGSAHASCPCVESSLENAEWHSTLLENLVMELG